MTKAQAQFILETLKELVVDSDIDFGPAHALATERQLEALRMMRDFIKTL